MFRSISLAILVSAAALWAQSEGPAAEGEALFQKQDWKCAAQAFQSAVQKDPHDGRSWFRLGSSLYRTGHSAEARDAFQKASENKFQVPQAMAAVARGYAHDGDAAKAAEWLNRATAAGFAGLAFVDNDADFAKVKSDPAFVQAREGIARVAQPCLHTPEYRQFDFWVGEWDVKVSGQVVGGSRIEKILDGCVIQENWMPTGGTQGKSWNYYNASTKKWEQVWMSAGSTLKFEGTFHDGALHYEGLTPLPGGAKRQEKLTFTPLPQDRVHQVWEQSTDGGKTWITAFDGIYVPKKKS